MQHSPMSDGWTIVERKSRKAKKRNDSLSESEYDDNLCEEFNYASQKCDETFYNRYPQKIVNLSITKKFSTALQKARQDHKLTRLQLSILINEKESVIQLYESGCGLAEYFIIDKINKELHTVLPKLKKNKY